MKKSVIIDPGQGGFEAIVGDFLDYCRTKNLSVNTLQYYRHGLDMFLNYLHDHVGDRRPGEVSTPEIRSYIAHLMDLGYANKTINHRLQALKAFFGFMVDEECIPTSPAAKVKPQKVQRKIIPTFSEEQIQNMLQACDCKTFLGLRDFTIIVTLLDTGLRVSELVGIELEDVDLDKCLIKVLGKGNKERVVPFGESVGKKLRMYIRKRGKIDDEFHVFVTQYGEPMTRQIAYRAIRNAGKKADVTGVRVSPHTARHSFAKTWVVNGGDPFSLQKILGHTTQDMVSKYVNMAVGDLQVQHSKFSPVDGLSKTAVNKRTRIK